MGELMIFEKGCHHCANLVRSGKNTYMCMERVHMDDSSVIPILDGKHTDDWNICNGESYKYMSNKYSKMS
jgi:hypothetical protein